MKNLLLTVAIILFLAGTSINTLNAQGTITAICADTLLYPLANTTTYRGINVYDSSATALAQWYYAPSTVTLYGFEFFGYENDPNTSNPVEVIGKVYEANGKVPGQLLAADTIMVSSTPGSGTYPFNRRQFITFNNPINISGAFIVSVEAPGPTMLVVLTNNWDTQDGNSQFYNAAQIGGIWYNGASVNVGGAPFNADILIHPIVSYTYSSSFTMDKNCIDDGEEVNFTHSTSNFFSHLFYNQYAYNDTAELAHHWNYGDGNVSNGLYPGSHTFATKGKYVVTVTDSIQGWRNNCVIQHKDSVDQQPVASFNYGVDGNKLNLTNTSLGTDDILWIFGDGTLSKQENPTYGYVSGGMYDVSLVINNACGADTITKNIQIFNIGIDENEALDKITIYPNPANDHIIISTANSNSDIIMELFDIVGNRLLENIIVRNTTEINISHLSSGTYFLRISGEDGYVIRKIIKE